MLDQTTSNYQSSYFVWGYWHIVDFLDVLSNVHNEPIAMIDKVINYNITDLSISDGRWENWDIIFPAPVVYTFLVVDLLAKAIDDLAWWPDCSILLLLLMHLFDNGTKPVLNEMVVVVGDLKVTCAVNTLLEELLST